MDRTSAIEVLARWLVEHEDDFRNEPSLDIDDENEFMWAAARWMASALMDPAMQGPLANPEFVMKLPGHSPSCVHITASSISFGRAT